jgi:ABC-type dipeptide/oligopeptide/nickel transport system permease subunit
MDDASRNALEHGRSIIHGALNRAARAERQEAFQKLDRRELAAMDDKQLAEWQSHYPRESAQYILAEHEWQRRLTAEQIRATRFSAVIGIIGVAVGAVLGWLLPSWHPFH